MEEKNFKKKTKNISSPEIYYGFGNELCTSYVTQGRTKDNIKELNYKGKHKHLF